MNPVLELLGRHRSIRRYTDAPVPDEHVREAVRAGQAASTSSAVQAYCLIRVRDPATRGALVDLTGGQEKVAEAGAFFVVCGDVRRHRLACRARGVAYEARLEAFLVAVVDASLFAQNLCVAFESLGYGICYVGGLRNHIADVDRLLDLPEGVYPLYGLCVGVPAQEPAIRPRLPLEAVLFEERYPDDETVAAQLDAYDDEVRRYLERRGAAPQGFQDGLAEKHRAPRRTDLAAFYASKGARLD
jgi:nitroreductase